ncbi:exonuclease domain-containing protein [Streptomyces sp. G1]|uniref:exonuclease domain-containing protein n=1 Tax=Streptomyces sp. G1 TaxID=361572 RepID=UPI00203051F1|nr:exonuclease domain-containing protein [Streptomyces sp. G1]MCM1964909.1 exonuclease domain-containing protein [Streptomyces sp. G1]
MSWLNAPLVGFDVETTGPDPETARIVTACAVRWGGGMPPRSRSWLSDVDGEEIPDEAAEIHGVTTEAARSAGRPARAVTEELVTVLAASAAAGMPLVIMNAPYDLTVLDRECARFGLPTVFELAQPVIIDPRVLDKRVDRYRKGRRTLTALCEHYGVELTAAHSADADASAACAVAHAIGSRVTWVGQRDAEDLHMQQLRWARQQAEGLRDYFAASSDPETAAQAPGVRLDWPLIPRPRTGGGEVR